MLCYFALFVCLFAFACFFLSSFSYLSLKHVYMLGTDVKPQARFESHLRRIFLGKVSLGCAVLLCLVCLFVCLCLLLSFFLLLSLIKTCIYVRDRCVLCYFALFVCLFAFACFFLSSFSYLSLKHVYMLGTDVKPQARFESHLRRIFLGKVSLGCAVLLCLVCLFVCLCLLLSFFLLLSLIKTCIYVRDRCKTAGPF